jgi:hypothetical protein
VPICILSAPLQKIHPGVLSRVKLNFTCSAFDGDMPFAAAASVHSKRYFSQQDSFAGAAEETSLGAVAKGFDIDRSPPAEAGVFVKPVRVRNLI